MTTIEVELQAVEAPDPDSEVKEKEKYKKKNTSLPDSKTNHSIPSSKIFLVILIYFLDVSVYLSEKLDTRNFINGFSFIWMKWTEKPHIQVKGWGWLFKVFLWCLRWVELKTDVGT